MLGFLLRIAERSRPTASAVFEGTRTCQPIAWAQVHLATHRVPRIADVLAESARHSHDDRGSEPVVRAPPHCAAVVELLGGGVRVFPEWISATGMSPEMAMPTARPMIPSSDRLVSNTRATPNRFCSPSVTRCTPPLTPTSSPNTSALGLRRARARSFAAPPPEIARLVPPSRPDFGPAEVRQPFRGRKPPTVPGSPGWCGLAVDEALDCRWLGSCATRAPASAAATSRATSCSRLAHSRWLRNVGTTALKFWQRIAGHSAAISASFRYPFWLSGPE